MRRALVLAFLLIAGCSEDEASPGESDAGGDAASDATTDTTLSDSFTPGADATDDGDGSASEVSADAAATDALLDTGPGAPGTLDLSFGDKGIACHAISSGDGAVTFGSRPAALLLQPDGKVVVIGQALGIEIVRFAANGELDFAKLGTVIPAAAGTTDDVPWAGALMPDGGFLVGGTHEDFADGGTQVAPLLVRYKSDGTTDGAAFGGKAYLLPSYGAFSAGAVRAVAIVGGKIVVAGSLVDGAGVAHGFVARHLAGGALDTTFGDGGLRTFSFAPTGSSFVLTMNVAPDESIALAGQLESGTTSEIGVARMSADGALDAAFGTGGVVHAPIAGAKGAVGLTRQSSGALVVTGTDDEIGGGYAVARFSAAGSLDTTFGTMGLVGRKPDTYSSRAVLAGPDDSLLVGAQATAATDAGTIALFSVERFGKDGAVDSTFGVGGQTKTSTSGYDPPRVVALARQSDGRIVAAGRAREGICVARYWP